MLQWVTKVNFVNINDYKAAYIFKLEKLLLYNYDSK